MGAAVIGPCDGVAGQLATQSRITCNAYNHTAQGKDVLSVILLGVHAGMEQRRKDWRHSYRTTVGSMWTYAAIMLKRAG